MQFNRTEWYSSRWNGKPPKMEWKKYIPADERPSSFCCCGWQIDNHEHQTMIAIDSHRNSEVGSSLRGDDGMAIPPARHDWTMNSCPRAPHYSRLPFADTNNDDRKCSSQRLQHGPRPRLPDRAAGEDHAPVHLPALGYRRLWPAGSRMER
jgi:hypothetical protein